MLVFRSSKNTFDFVFLKVTSPKLSDFIQKKFFLEDFLNNHQSEHYLGLAKSVLWPFLRCFFCAHCFPLQLF